MEKASCRRKGTKKGGCLTRTTGSSHPSGELYVKPHIQTFFLYLPVTHLPVGSTCSSLSSPSANSGVKKYRLGLNASVFSFQRQNHFLQDSLERGEEWGSTCGDAENCESESSGGHVTWSVKLQTHYLLCTRVKPWESPGCSVASTVACACGLRVMSKAPWVVPIPDDALPSRQNSASSSLSPRALLSTLEERCGH